MRPGSRVLSFTYGQLDAVEEISRRTGIPETRIRSMRAHPYALPDDLAILAAVGDDGGSATLSLIPGWVCVDDRSSRISWASGWSARRDGSASGAALLLQAIRRSGSFGGHLLSGDAVRVYRAARAQIVSVPRLVMLRRSLPHWRQVTPKSIAPVLSMPTDIVLGAVYAGARLRSRPRSQGYTVEEVDIFDERLDLVDRSSGCRFMFPRDHRELNWAMTEPWDAGSRYRCFYLTRAGNDDVIAYAWVRIRTFGGARVASVFRTGVTSDHCNAMPILFDRVLSALLREDPALVDIAGTDPLLLATARSRGFFPHGHLDLGILFGSEERKILENSGRDLTSFRINMAEGDVLFL